MTARTCTTTGLRLRPADGAPAYRVAQDRHGVFKAFDNRHVGPMRGDPSDPRNRFDTVGRTVYFGESAQAVFAEVLRPFRRVRANVSALAKLAGYDDEGEYAMQVETEARANNRDVPWAISGDWQFARSHYVVSMPEHGWWVDIGHPDTLDSLTNVLRPDVRGPDGQREDITLSHVYGEDRAVTTAIAQAVKESTLDDGHEPLGIRYESKTAMGRCFAWWDRRADADLPMGRNDPHLVSSTNVDTPEMREVAERYQLPVLDGRPNY